MADQFLECQRDLLRLQRGVITRRQALAAGLTEKAIVVRLQSGRWQRLQTGVYAAFSGEPPRPAILWAAVLRAGHGAVLSHQTAAELHGLIDTPARLIHLTVPSGNQVRRPAGTTVHYSARLDQTRHPALLPPRSRVEDNVLDLVGDATSLDEVVSLISLAVGRRRTTAQLILAALACRRRMRWRADIVRALEITAEGAQSVLEHRYVTRVERPHGLPRGSRQRVVSRNGAHQYQDVSYDYYLVVVELDGLAAHPPESRWRDVRRDNTNTAEGMATLRLGYVDVSERNCESATLVGQTLRSRGWQGMLRRCGCSCRALS
jgi:hypothetical protein